MGNTNTRDARRNNAHVAALAAVVLVHHALVSHAPGGFTSDKTSMGKKVAPGAQHASTPAASPVSGEG